jgi:hypothetical protein
MRHLSFRQPAVSLDDSIDSARPAIPAAKMVA